MRKAVAALAILLTALVAAEFYFAAAGGAGASYAPHHALGPVIFSLPVVIAIVAAIGRLPRPFVILPLVVTALVGFQVAITKLSLDTPYIFGLHALGAMAIAAVTFRLLQSAVRPTQPD